MHNLTPSMTITGTPGLTFDERRVLRLLTNHTYDQVVQQTGWSRGRIYKLAIRVGARKTEARIKERQQHRRERQAEFLTEIINTTAKCDVLDRVQEVRLTFFFWNHTEFAAQTASAFCEANRFFEMWIVLIIVEFVVAADDRFYGMAVSGSGAAEDRVGPVA